MFDAKSNDGKSTWVRIGVYLTIIIFISFNSSYAQKPYTTTSELICDNLKVEITTECIEEDFSPIIPHCNEQQIIFYDNQNNKLVKKTASGKLVDVFNAKGEKIGGWLDAIATSWICAKGKNQSYLIVWYNTGGNCDECEWQEIFNLQGNRLSSNKLKTKQDYYSYNNILDKLGLSNIKPDDFLDIKLKRTSKYLK